MGDRLSSLRVSMVGLEFGISVTLGILGGLWLDNRFGTAPWLLLLCMGLGILAGFRNMIRVALRAQGDSQAAPAGSRKDPRSEAEEPPSQDKSEG